ncbi:MAG: tetraacyldisaccharide 4'-kinase [Caldimicrobium sp.]|nr:tetraacyldisaccharide 4'-kinase [Caldimicrobium sp.]MCX7613709.1 tetraacyldisaccharide 4'-kinase [Caldimicrobium sp.]MDW8093963.1 tetraacyldisaccharide 4'-kinase [Caldimicrobium sp.]MDW8183128.1 tetraacyldisaccharide 4'-kinase [Caldimicrobium sp.]
MNPLEILNPYLWIVSLRNSLYDCGLIRVKRLPVKVISIGNLSCGGTGKTTLTRYLAEKLSQTLKVGILLRGYKRKTIGYREVLSRGELRASLEEAGDEAYLLAYLFRGHHKVSVSVCEDRVVGGEKMCEDLEIEVLLLDDAFQHRRIHRDLDMVLIKKQDLSDKLLPFGRLREPLTSLKRAQALILTYQEIYPFDFNFHDKPIFKMYRTKWKILDHSLREITAADLPPLISFSGLGFNSQFREIVNRLNLKIKDFYFFPDHYDYRNFKLQPEEKYLTTLKDFVKLTPSPNLYLLDFEVEVPGLLDYVMKRLTQGQGQLLQM